MPDPQRSSVHAAGSTLLVPWRSAGVAAVALAVVLLAGVPVFLCMPPAADLTHYDLIARSLLTGGTLYRDRFDTNLPGFVWALAVVRAVVGPSLVAVRAVDLVIVGGACGLLGVWVRRSGGSAASARWFAVGCALFYLGTSEWNHAQRDSWMLLPSAAAGLLRVRRLTDPAGVWRSLVEGALWGAAVWLKPHVVIPAAAAWAGSALWLARRFGWRALASDLLGLLVGGLAVGGAGVSWLVGSGTWPHFWEVFAEWNSEYVDRPWQGATFRLTRSFYLFGVWGLLQLAALAVAGCAAVRGLVAAWRKAEPDPATAGRAVLAAVYLGWFAQAVVLQKGFEYVLVPHHLLGFAVLAAHRWPVGLIAGGWFVAVWLATALIGPLASPLSPWIRFDRHRLTDPWVVTLWPRCVREGPTPELMDRLGFYGSGPNGATWVELHQVADFLRTLDPPLRDRELTCWHDTTHPLYLTLGLEPSTRYLQVGTAFSFRSKAGRIGREVADCPHRYLVSDLRRMTRDAAPAYAPGAGGRPDRLPVWFPVSQRGVFPWDQQIVFRAGRYLVHRVDHRPSVVDIPAWADVDKLGPGE